MILSDREIRLAMERGLVGISPAPDADLWTSTAIDLRLDGQVRRWKEVKAQSGVKQTLCFRPADPEFNFSAIVEEYTEVIEIPDEGLELGKDGFLLGWTLERVKLPNYSRICARVEGKSSLARLGLGIHVTAPTIHAGFGASEQEGSPLQLEIWKVGPVPVELRKGMRICQLIFEEVHGTPEKGYHGQFGVQGPTTSE
jgi:dCTP deaminase